MKSKMTPIFQEQAMLRSEELLNVRSKLHAKENESCVIKSLRLKYL